MNSLSWRVVLSVGVAVAVVVTVLAAMTTSRASVSATTGNESNVFASGRLDVDTNTREELLFDHDGLYPGLLVESCFDVRYRGSIEDVSVRLFSELTSDTGLATHLDVGVWTGTGAESATCDDFEPDGAARFTGSLSDLSRTHPGFENGLVVLAAADPGERTALRIRALIRDDGDADAAQGGAADFTLVVEARP